MAKVSSPREAPMHDSPEALPDTEPRYGGFTRFEIELEFVQSLGSPAYISHLAAQKYFEQPAFVAYLKYLLYFNQPPYLQYLLFPGPTLKNLELLQEESFRTNILRSDVTQALIEEGRKAAVEWPNK
ncbi:mediator of RNA polymerase II transcription subunit 31 [Calycina marina]|uniref:Mediator of RNA polymerase II transcription subunit 31 n=1 Tax=Calycina marina TaxID=1763456 RepID=A0A9P8CEF8_9HELO|nr:mediator of RNA polymerase II transcription subunit 31 [Calycina marina]